MLSVANGKLAWIEPSYANISVSTYKVGDIYYNRSGMPEGVVIEVSSVGRYGKIISLKEIENKVWSTEYESVDVTNDTDGAGEYEHDKTAFGLEHKISGICKCSR